MPKRPVVFVFAGAYLPGFKAGGPIQSIANLVEYLGDDIEFRIVAADRDLGDAVPYGDLEPHTWHRVGKALVWYERPPGAGTLHGLLRLMRDTPHDVIYLNSFYSVRWTLRPIAYTALSGRHVPLIIAPRGQFSPGALALKSWKKRPYLSVVRRLRSVSGATWQATAPHEAAAIRQAIGEEAKVVLAPDLPRQAPAATLDFASQRATDDLRLLFLSRISPMKNLNFAIEALQDVRKHVHFTICGPREDHQYWSTCVELIRRMPPNVKVTILDPVPPHGVPELMAANDLLFLPTRGENYGHVIGEALSVGTPVLISDQTPWRDLERDGFGWDVPLHDMATFTSTIDQVASLPAAARAQWRARIRRDIAARLVTPEAIEQNRRLFLDAVRRGPAHELRAQQR